MNNDPKQLTVYVVPDAIDEATAEIYDGRPAMIEYVSTPEVTRTLVIGIWRRRHDSWQIEIAVPVSVDIRPVQLHVH